MLARGPDSHSLFLSANCAMTGCWHINADLTPENQRQTPADLPKERWVYPEVIDLNKFLQRG
ncbi:hypothetical protein F7661_12630 [Pseudomonas sp. CFA]|nr:hypothetical protein F7661_12630 [Pseudomonas sp. CFA]